MQDDKKIKELLNQIDSLNEELSSYDDVLSKINSIRKRKSAAKSKLKKIMSNELERNQKARLISPNNNEYIISKESTEKLDIARMKKDGIYEKYVLPVEAVKIKEQRTLYEWS